MKALRAAVLSIAILLVSGVVSQPASAAVSFSFFYSNLGPHGNWLVSAQYGRVWQPAAYRPGWNPYYDGHWVYADVGWTWVSDYAWGDVPYHYGTWYPDPALGWVWVPGYVWAPAWVVFRTGPDYIGWAPVAPGFSVGVSYASSAYAAPFLYVSAGHFCEPGVRRWVVPESQARVLVERTRVVNNLTIENNIVVNRGPDPRVIERASGRRIRTENIGSVPRVAPGGGHFDRAAMAVGSQNRWQGVRAADPISSRQPLPDAHAHAQGNARADAHVVGAASAREVRTQAHAAPRSGESHPPQAHAASTPQHHVSQPAPPPHVSRPAPQPGAAHGAPNGSQGHPANGGKPHDGKPHGGESHDGHPHDR